MNKEKIINRIFNKQDKNGFWKLLPQNDKRYSTYLHYTPCFSATIWTLILLSDLKIDKNEKKAINSLNKVKEKLFDQKYGIYTLKEDHFPIPCLNGNMIYLDAYFNNKPTDYTYKVIDFFHKNQRFDDGEYKTEINEYCKNKSCYDKHTCYWGIIKLFKGLSHIPIKYRNEKANELISKCIDFVLLHKVCYSSKKKDKIMIKDIDKLTFPNMYRSDFLEILWLLKREKVHSKNIESALNLLKLKQLPNGNWNLERKVNNMVAGIGEINNENQFITNRANEILNYYNT